MSHPTVPRTVAARDAGEPTIPLFGFDIAALPFDKVVDVLSAAALCRDGRARVVVTPNVDHVVRLDSQPELKRLYSSADYLFADGTPLVLASRLFGTPLPGRVTGSDLLPALCERAQKAGWKVAIVGGQPGHEQPLIDGLAARFPRLDFELIVPSMKFDPTGPEGEAVAERVRAAAPDIVFVCVGMPKQERWALHHADKLPGGVMLCVGAAIEFAAGLRQRAPRWMQRTGLEWGWRLLQDPKRLWRRYLVEGPRFIGICWRYWRNRHARTNAV